LVSSDLSKPYGVAPAAEAEPEDTSTLSDAAFRARDQTAAAAQRESKSVSFAEQYAGEIKTLESALLRALGANHRACLVVRDPPAEGQQRPTWMQMRARTFRSCTPPQHSDRADFMRVCAARTCQGRSPSFWTAR
jgi:hypothetical protein